MDHNHNTKFNDTKIKNNNFNLSGPVNLRQDNCSIPFDSSIVKPINQVSITRDSNKSQQLVPDTNSTLAYTAHGVNSNMANKPAKRCILNSVINPAKTKYSPHALYFKRHKQSKESPYGTSGSNESSGGSKSQNPKPTICNDYTSNSLQSNSGMDSHSSNPSNPAIATINVSDKKFSLSDEKQLEPTYREKKETQNPDPLSIIQDYGIKDPRPIEIPLKRPSQKLQESMVASSPSRGSVLTNPQGGRFGSSLNNSNTQEQFPLKPGKAIQVFKGVLTEYEKGEILNYREIYCVGEKATHKKVGLGLLIS